MSAIFEKPAIHVWEPLKRNTAGLVVQFQCSECFQRWGWTGEEWAYLKTYSLKNP